MQTLERTRPYFIESTDPLNLEPLRTGATVETDVAILGAGFTGLTAAYHLLEAGKRVCVIDLGEVAGGDSGFSTAQLTEFLDMHYHTLISKFGVDDTRLVAHGTRAAMNWVEQTVEKLGIQCGLQRVPAYLFADHSDQSEEIEKEFEACIRVGVHAERTDAVPEYLNPRGAIRIQNQIQLHPRQFLQGLAKALKRRFAEIFEYTQAVKIEDGTPCTITTHNGALIRAKQVVVGTHSPVCNLIALHTKIAAYRTYVLGIRTTTPLDDALYFDTNTPYHYIRKIHSQQDGPLVLVGGEDHKTGTVEETDHCFDRLEEYARDRFDVAAISYRWSGQVLEPIDGLPFIGKNPGSENLYVGTGYSGNGTTYGPLAGLILSDAILGRPNPYAEILAATRIKPLAGAKNFLMENASVAAHWIGDKFKHEDNHALSDVPRGEGRILSIKGKKFACYKNEAGACSILSPVCTHLGGTVHWNSAEKSWDCPCHGARFAADGSVITGPASKALEQEQLPN